MTNENGCTATDEGLLREAQERLQREGDATVRDLREMGQAYMNDMKRQDSLGEMLALLTGALSTGTKEASRAFGMAFSAGNIRAADSAARLLMTHLSVQALALGAVASSVRDHGADHASWGFLRDVIVRRFSDEGAKMLKVAETAFDFSKPRPAQADGLPPEVLQQLGDLGIEIDSIQVFRL